MSELDKIKKFLANRRASFVSSVRLVQLSKTLLLEVPINLLKETAAKGFTSKRQITFLSRAIEKEFDVRVLVAFRESQELIDLEAGIRATLIRRFRGFILDFNMSFIKADTALVWVMLAKDIDTTNDGAIRNQVVTLMGTFGIECENVELIRPSKPEPSIVAILRSIKILAPVDLAELKADIERRDMHCPSSVWLSAKLDGARKKGLVVRNPTGKYSLSAAGLAIVPYSKSRSSSDIDRILAIAKRW